MDGKLEREKERKKERKKEKKRERKRERERGETNTSRDEVELNRTKQNNRTLKERFDEWPGNVET